MLLVRNNTGVIAPKNLPNKLVFGQASELLAWRRFSSIIRAKVTINDTFTQKHIGQKFIGTVYRGWWACPAPVGGPVHPCGGRRSG